MASFVTEFQHLEIRIEDIKSATNNFDDSNVIGVGGFGKVYKGELFHSEGETVVALKRLDRKFGQGDPEFFKEIRMLSCYRYPNLISLLGFCNEGGEMVLVYEHASRGSLDHLLSDAALMWTQRLNICLDSAKGLSFLHDPNGRHQRVLHCDIKSANILLDENLNAMVSDFGLSKMGPANQQNSVVVTRPVGTPGYCDPSYMETYSLTKESDVYSFGVVLFEVLFGRLCVEDRNGKLIVFVPFWKKCYEENKLDEIIFKDLMQQMDPRCLEKFTKIAFQCLDKSREKRPTMSLVVETLENALEIQERHHMYSELPKEYEVIAKAAVHRLNYKSLEDLKGLLSKGIFLNEGKTRLSINDKGEHCELISIEDCLIQDGKKNRLHDPYWYQPRFPGWRCYTYVKKFKTRARPQFLSPLTTYMVNLVFKFNSSYQKYIAIRYKLEGETKIVILDVGEKKDEWLKAELYQFTSKHAVADLEIMFEDSTYEYELEVSGIQFQPVNKVENDQVLEYRNVVKAASHYLMYRSVEELDRIFSRGVHLNSYKTWFSLNKNGEHCETISIADCLIHDDPNEEHRYMLEYRSRFPKGLYRTQKKGFKVQVRAQFLSPMITYTMNLVFSINHYVSQQKYVGLKYKLGGETRTSLVYLAYKRDVYAWYMAELYQFTSDQSVIDLEISFDNHEHDLRVEGILFQPLEKY